MDPKFEINKGMISRYEKTLSFIQTHTPYTKKILDLGICNPFSDILKENGYEVFNTHGEDLDYHPEVVKQYDGIECVTALEICEHLINPMGVLSQLPSDKLIASIPLSLWLKSASI